MMYLIFIKQNNPNRFVKTGDSEIWNKKQNDIPTKTQWKKMWWNLCGSSTQIRLKLKLKKAPKDQNKADFRSSIQTKKNKKQINQEEYY